MVDWSSKPNRVQSWTAARGTDTLFAGPDDTVALASSDERIAWIGATGVGAVGGLFDTARVYWSPMTTDPKGISTAAGPDVTGLLQGRVSMATAGDIVAFSNGGTSEGAPAGLYVYRVSANSLTFVPARSSHWLKLAAVSPTEAVLMEWPRSDTSGVFERWLRFDLSRLEELTKGWE